MSVERTGQPSRKPHDETDAKPRAAYATPRLVDHGTLVRNTAGGSAAAWSEALRCENQQIFFRC